ncbi:MAG: GNAT family N-acetyltransferase [Lachnospiraceae bacterium]|nr:GNAT family N-acetyltransferase [Lachnospiraceae bacterium]
MNEAKEPKKNAKPRESAEVRKAKAKAANGMREQAAMEPLTKAKIKEVVLGHPGIQEMAETLSTIPPEVIFSGEKYLGEYVKRMRLRMEHLDEVGNNPDDPERVAEWTDALLGLHYKLIKNVNPFWSVGQDRIDEWHQDVERFKERTEGRHPLLMRLNKKNRRFGEAVIPEDELAFAGDPMHFLLVALRPVPTDGSQREPDENLQPEVIGEEDIPYIGETAEDLQEFLSRPEVQWDPSLTTEMGNIPNEFLNPNVPPAWTETAASYGNEPVGGLSCRVVQVESFLVAEITWLFVDPAYEGRGIAHSLIAELIRLLRPIGPIGINLLFDPTTLEDDGDILSRVLGDFHFQMDLAGDPTFRIRLGDLIQSKEPQTSEDIHPLADLPPGELSRELKQFVRQQGPAYDPYLPFVPDDYWDKKLSQYCYTGGTLDFFLVHRTDGGELEIVAARGERRTLLRLINAAGAAAKNEDPDTMIRFCEKSEFAAYMREKVLHIREQSLKMIAVLQNPPDDVTTEEFDRFIKNLGQTDAAAIRGEMDEEERELEESLAG